MFLTSQYALYIIEKILFNQIGTLILAIEELDSYFKLCNDFEIFAS